VFGRFLALSLALICAACAPLNAPYTPKDVEQVARMTYEDIRHDRQEALRARMAPELLEEANAALLSKMSETLPRETTTASRTLSWRINQSSSGQGASLTQEYSHGDRIAIFDIHMVRVSDSMPWRVDGMHVRAVSDVDQARNRFTLSNRGAGAYAFLAMMIASAVLMATAFVSALRAPGLKRRWLWAVASLFVLGSLRMDWSSEAMNFQLFWIGLVNFGVGQVGGSNAFPWVLKFALPVGAAFTLWRTRKARNDARKEPEGS
jgi:hypothetical protein